MVDFCSCYYFRLEIVMQRERTFRTTITAHTTKEAGVYSLDLAVKTQTWTTDRLATIADRLLPVAIDEADHDDVDSRHLAVAWIVIIGVFVVAAAAAWALCLSKGYRGFTGEMKLHTKWKVPIGIKLECY